MTLYKNSRIEDEMREDDIEEKIIETNNAPEPDNEEEKTFKKRFADQTRWFQEKEARYKEEIANLSKQMQKIASGEIRPPKSEAEIVEWEKEYPDFAQIMDARVERIVESKIKGHRETIKDIKKEKALMELRGHHPDVDTILRDAEFYAWLDKQSSITQKAIKESLNVQDAADVIERYKMKVLSKKKKSGDDDFEDNRKDTARAVRTKSSSPIVDEDGGEWLYSESQIDRMSDRQYEAESEKIMKAMREGKVLMDLQAGAR